MLLLLRLPFCLICRVIFGAGDVGFGDRSLQTEIGRMGGHENWLGGIEWGGRRGGLGFRPVLHYTSFFSVS
jgi:hypothetical protein